MAEPDRRVKPDRPPYAVKRMNAIGSGYVGDVRYIHFGDSDPRSGYVWYQEAEGRLENDDLLDVLRMLQFLNSGAPLAPGVFTNPDPTYQHAEERGASFDRYRRGLRDMLKAIEDFSVAAQTALQEEGGE